MGDTAHLTNEEHGVYLRLLMFAWRSPDCALPDDDRRLAIMTGLSDKKWSAIRPVIAAFWIIAEGAWTQKRLTKERDFVRGKSEKNRDAAKARWNGKPLESNKTHDANAKPTHMPEPCQTDAPIPIPIPIKKEREVNLSSASGEVEAVLGAWVSQDAASSFLAYRRKHKARALTLTGAKRLATHLQAILNAGFDPSDALAMAEERGWASVEPDWYFREKAKQNGNGNHNGAGGTNQRRAGGPHDSMVAAFAYVASREPH